ncbi:hypothetical protein NDU88_002728 [Pleurodeles waltl]|uniref:Uncharacterized protein n=1 Tax=Pleurodeles waltl TaxID=8319 RepID=A0AAV7M1H3_PLEWA|nr:hypothetical protein NDU88_002728 [Pleurodeles waltl]
MNQSLRKLVRITLRPATTTILPRKAHRRPVLRKRVGHREERKEQRLLILDMERNLNANPGYGKRCKPKEKGQQAGAERTCEGLRAVPAVISKKQLLLGVIRQTRHKPSWKHEIPGLRAPGKLSMRARPPLPFPKEALEMPRQRLICITGL